MKRLCYINRPVYASESCAVVFPTPRLLEREDGAAIDAHETVVRFNAHATSGYEAHTGAKTDLLFCNFGHRALKYKNKIFTLWKTWVCAPRLKMVHYERIRILLMREGLTSEPTAGLVALTILTLSGIRPTLYGFQPARVYGYFHDPEAASGGTGWHDILQEKRIILSWAASGLLNLK